MIDKSLQMRNSELTWKAMSVQVCYEHVSEQGNELYELVSIHLIKRKKKTPARTMLNC